MKTQGADLPLEMGDLLPGQDPKEVKIGICRHCYRQGLLSKFTHLCTGYRAVTSKGGLVQVPESRRIRCNILHMRQISNSNRKLLAQVERQPIQLKKVSV
jgi:hypothetical protein